MGVWFVNDRWTEGSICELPVQLTCHLGLRPATSWKEFPSWRRRSRICVSLRPGWKQKASSSRGAKRRGNLLEISLGFKQRSPAIANRPLSFFPLQKEKGLFGNILNHIITKSSWGCRWRILAWECYVCLICEWSMDRVIDFRTILSHYTVIAGLYPRSPL